MKSTPFSKLMEKNARSRKRLVWKPRAALAFALAALTLSACRLKFKETFAANQVAASLKRLCAQEYKLSLETRHEKNTLQAFLWNVGILQKGDGEIRPETAQNLESILMCATRVALSTDATLDFIEIKVADALSGSSITLWRYVPDIRDSIYEKIGEEEYINRLLIEVSGKDSVLTTRDGVLWDEPMTLPEFLARQVVLRAKRMSPVGLQAHADLSEPTQLVVVIENWSSLGKSDTQSKVSDLVGETAQAVMHQYRFSGFRHVVLQDGRGAALHSWKL